MKLAIIIGSQRKASQSGKVGAYCQQQLRKLDASLEIETLDLGKDPLPWWTEGLKDAKLDQWKARLQKAEGFVVVSPEWGGMVPPALKNFFLLMGGAELAHKPALIVGVSAGISGTYPIAELRTTSTKNNHLCYIPDHVIVRFAETVLNEAEPQNDSDRMTRARLDSACQVLLHYAASFRQIRERVGPVQFPNGM